MVYVCLLCGKRFGSRKDVRKHVREEHGVKGKGKYGDKKSVNSPITQNYRYE